MTVDEIVAEMYHMSREEREELVARVLEKHVNYGGTPYYALADRVSKWHRYLQGEMFEIVRNLIMMWAGKLDSNDFDPRNEYAVKRSAQVLEKLEGTIEV